MTPALEKALHRCPRGTTVWTSCLAGQFSYEYKHAQVDTLRLPKFDIWGSVFLNVFLPLQVHGIRDKWSRQAGNLPPPRGIADRHGKRNRQFLHQ